VRTCHVGITSLAHEPYFFHLILVVYIFPQLAWTFWEDSDKKDSFHVYVFTGTSTFSLVGKVCGTLKDYEEKKKNSMKGMIY
jgi:hypothetical protein